VRPGAVCVLVAVAGAWFSIPVSGPANAGDGIGDTGLFRHVRAEGPSANMWDPQTIIDGTCTRCHRDRSPQGNLSLEAFEVARAAEEAETSEKMIRKLRAGMMPPPGAGRRPPDDSLRVLAETLETLVDDAAASSPTPGTRTFQRLNRPEYGRAIYDLLGLVVDPSKWLPNDQLSANFDNIADVQSLSPTLLDAYLNAAAEISRLAVGDRGTAPINQTYKNSQYVSQHPWDRVEGAPFGTRGGMVVDHVFPADGEYTFSLVFTSGANSYMEDVDVSVDGERVALLHYTRRGGGADDRGFTPVATEPIFVRAGQRRVSAAFIRRQEGPYEDLIRPHG